MEGFIRRARDSSLLVATSLFAASSAWAAAQTASCYKVPTSAQQLCSEVDGVTTGKDWCGPMQFKDGGVVSGYGRVIYAVGTIMSPSSKSDTNILDDSAKGFEQFLQSNHVNPGALVVLHSPGGSAFGGMQIGELIRKYSLRTMVGQPAARAANSPLTVLASAAPAKGLCASACSIAFLGGTHRVVLTGSLYGVHSVESETESQGETLADIFYSGQQIAALESAYLVEMGIDPSWLNLAIQCISANGEIQFLTPAEMAQTKTITAFTTSWTLQDIAGDIELVGANPESAAIPNYHDFLTFVCNGTPRRAQMYVDYLPEAYNAGEPSTGVRSSPAAFTKLVSGFSLIGFKTNSVASDKPTVLDIDKSDVVAPLSVVAVHFVTTTIGVTPAVDNLLKAVDTLQFSFKGQTAPVGQVNFDLSVGHQFINDYVAACQ